MNKLISNALVLQNELGLPDDKLQTIVNGMRSYAADTMNVAKTLIEKRESPEMIRKLMEPHGMTYDGTKKKFK